jgi:hypothetical protein
LFVRNGNTLAENTPTNAMHCTTEDIGSFTDGTYTQSTGLNSVTTLGLGQSSDTRTNQGTYNLSGGTLAVGAVVICHCGLHLQSFHPTPCAFESYRSRTQQYSPPHSPFCETPNKSRPT